MANKINALNKDEGTDGMAPDLLHAASIGNIEEAIAALRNDPSCILNMNEYNMNALQIAMCQFHEEFSFYILNNTDVLVRTRDLFKRDSLDIAIIAGSENLCVAVNDRWHKERQNDISLAYIPT